MLRKLYPAKLETDTLQTEKSTPADIDNFLQTAAHINEQMQGRLIFALDATMSRQPTWDQASHTQAAMFTSVGQKTGLAVQLVYFRGFGECRASKWVSNPQALLHLMGRVECQGGTTKLSKVLNHSAKEHKKKRVSALVFIGDALEEDIDTLCDQAGKLGAQGIKAFMFQEGMDSQTERGFREIARLSGGAYMQFDRNSPKMLEELLSAVAAYATGGERALLAKKEKTAQLLLEQLKK